MSDQVVLKADKEHGGLQFTVPLIMLAAGTAGFMSIDSLVLAPLLGGGAWDSFRPVLRIVFSITLGVAVGGLAEMAFKRWWESGKVLRLDARGVTIERKEERPERIEWSKQLPVLRWKYGLHSYQRGGRERRVPASHLLGDEPIVRLVFVEGANHVVAKPPAILNETWDKCCVSVAADRVGIADDVEPMPAPPFTEMWRSQ